MTQGGRAFSGRLPTGVSSQNLLARVELFTGTRHRPVRPAHPSLSASDSLTAKTLESRSKMIRSTATGE